MYESFLSPEIVAHILKTADPVDGVPGLMKTGTASLTGTASKQPTLETAEALQFLVELYQQLKPELEKVLKQRELDREFIDTRTKALCQFNKENGIDWTNPQYQTIIGLEDSKGRLVFGPHSADYCQQGGRSIAPIPEYLQGPHVTLFGPPDSAKMAINAMNAYHRKLPGEPAIVQELLDLHPADPKWGADDEDSKTPLHEDLIDAGLNLTGCFEKTLKFEENSKKYVLAPNHLSMPIKRFPGLAMPCSFMFHQGSPLPLHLYDFALHFFRNWANPQALTFYVPKLENEEEARYIHLMTATAESLLQQKHPSYKKGTIRLMVVLENPRAILRAHEIIDALEPYFVGASLGWHDYLASTARLFKNDENYRIPVKADPDIVIKYIKASHSLLADVVGSRGGIKVGGMYGILPLANDLKSESFQVTLKGFFRDVLTQFKRDLTGYWVAHPDFVRIGLAIVSGWKEYKSGQKRPLQQLVTSLLVGDHAEEILKFIEAPDIRGLDKNDAGYVRSLIVADIKESDFIPNNHPDEIRYNVFQCIQYLTDWLCGNGCVALPALVKDIPVRVMDDLATTERSRWEVWHELHHGRFSLHNFIQICFEEMNFIRRDLSNDKKIVQVKWDERTAKWYPVAFKLMLKLMTDPNPCEFATELLMPFTLRDLRGSPEPWKAAIALAPEKFALTENVRRFESYFEACGSLRFATTLTQNPVYDEALARQVVLSFTDKEVIEAAHFHGDIGQSPKSLDATAAREQALVLNEEDAVKAELRSLGQAYSEKFGFKFLISAEGKTGQEMLGQLKARMQNSPEQELEGARLALWEITKKRLTSRPLDHIAEQIEQLRQRMKIDACSIAITDNKHVQSLAFNCSPETQFQLASLSKTLGSAFSMEVLRKSGTPLSTGVNQLLEQLGSSFRLISEKDPAWADRVTLEHLMNHSALNMHYIVGTPNGDAPLTVADRLKQIKVINPPGEKFNYSGGGFLVLEHLIELLEKKSVQQATSPFFEKLGLKNLSFRQEDQPGKNYISGYDDQGKPLLEGRRNFPAFAAGAMGTALDTLKFLKALAAAYANNDGGAEAPSLTDTHGPIHGPISHETAVRMLHGQDLGSKAFMGCLMGIGVFIVEAGENKFMVHQGANDGFRALFCHCFAGPDANKGFVIFCNANNPGVRFIAEVARLLLKHLQVSGVDFNKLGASSFLTDQISQEQIVNLGYKALLFDAFAPTMPEKNTYKSTQLPLAHKNLLMGAEILECSNQRFARAENLISEKEPVFDADHFGSQGKVMDSWESARHNSKECDWLILQLKNPEAVRFVEISTKYHDGNHAEFVRLLGRAAPNQEWQEITPKLQMLGHSYQKCQLAEARGPFGHIKIEMYPDGGLTRVGLYSELSENEAEAFKPVAASAPLRFADPIPKGKKPLTLPVPAKFQLTAKPTRINWASALFGAKILHASNEHYSPASQVISPYPALHMFDGLESARSRKPGHFEEVEIQLGRAIKIKEIVFDFTFFKNNNPKWVQVFIQKNDNWTELTPPVACKAFAGNKMQIFPNIGQTVNRILVRSLPDGGMNRIQVFED